MRRATTSFPEPVSPSTRTLASVRAAASISRRSETIAGLSPSSKGRLRGVRGEDSVDIESKLQYLRLAGGNKSAFQERLRSTIKSAKVVSKITLLREIGVLDDIPKKVADLASDRTNHLHAVARRQPGNPVPGIPAFCQKRGTV